MMSAMDPPLHERVYEGLKEDYLAGHFVPGKKIDIQDLATRHRSSKTPVRETAFIMVGEGLLVHHSDGGFLVPVREPGELIELLAWHMQLIAARSEEHTSELQSLMSITYAVFALKKKKTKQTPK